MLLQQVGIMFDGMGFVQFLLPGGPAHASGKIVNGDQIIKVDGIQVDGNGLLQAITGSDMPGSSVTFTIQKPSV
jgi:C-terminal processing protease CtpA/Prc